MSAPADALKRLGFAPEGQAALRRGPGATGTVIEVLGNGPQLRALVPEWEALAAEALEPNPFYEHWMLLPALEAYGAGDDFRCIAVWDNGTLGALFPMCLRWGWRSMPVRALRSWRHRNMLTCTPLVRAKAGTQAAANYIAAVVGSGLAPLVEFDWIAAGGPFFAALTDAVAERQWPWMLTDAYARALLVRGRDPRECFNSNMKNNLRRWRARLAAAGSLTPVRLAAGDNLATWTDEFMRLEASGWKGRAGTALACREDDRRFVAAVFGEAFRRGQLQISGLDLGGRPLARHIMFSAGEGSFSFKLAYDETHAKCSPGIVAEVENVGQFLETPALRWIDSNTARQSTGYARVWKDRRTVQRVAIGARPAGALALLGLSALRLAKHWVRRRRPPQPPES
jgi:hypothetical protein